MLLVCEYIRQSTFRFADEKLSPTEFSRQVPVTDPLHQGRVVSHLLAAVVLVVFPLVVTADLVQVASRQVQAVETSACCLSLRTDSTLSRRNFLLIFILMRCTQ